MARWVSDANDKRTKLRAAMSGSSSSSCAGPAVRSNNDIAGKKEDSSLRRRHDCACKLRGLAFLRMRMHESKQQEGNLIYSVSVPPMTRQ